MENYTRSARHFARRDNIIPDGENFTLNVFRQGDGRGGWRATKMANENGKASKVVAHVASGSGPNYSWLWHGLWLRRRGAADGDDDDNGGGGD